jgi:hypothetical protein
MKKSGTGKAIPLRGLTIEEIRLVSDLRVMHSKVDELFNIVESLRRRHGYDEIRKYADRRVLEHDIDNVDKLYLWFVKLREDRE